MAKKYELSLASDYVPTWTLIDAIRELFQNALDEETLDPTNKMSVDYDPEEQKLHISSYKSTLTTHSLLLGATTKASDKKTIGKFGEGYKIASLVLLRLGYGMAIFNLNQGEIWRPRFVNSKRYQAKVLTFFVERIEMIPEVDMPSLTFLVDGITPDEYEAIIAANLHLQDVGDTRATQYGDVLMEDCYKGKIFINGLFVCENKRITYGYNVKPEYLPIDRDRRIISDFDIQWLTSRMWSDASQHTEKVIDMLESGAPDTTYAKHHLTQAQRNEVLHDFVDKYGENAVPVSTQSEAEGLPKNYKAVIVPEAMKDVIKSASEYEEPVYTEEDATVLERLNNWFERAYGFLPNKLCDEFRGLLEELENGN